MSTEVSAWTSELTLPTYLPAEPDRNPMFLENRVYQGSSGRVYPLPFTDRIATRPIDRSWRAVWIENEYLRVLVLPEIGGRIHAIQDKTNGYDLIYNQPVIKPALVGLAGPWISGGIEFNWPQHHRPATFLPVDFQIEAHPDGSKTIWCGDHDPMARMKGMHGVTLHPAKAFLELKVRAYNRTPLVQTFLWWANVATRVHEAYQSFFPPDVSYVADHARRSMSDYPLARGWYYGVNYGERGEGGVPQDQRPRCYVPPHCPGSPAREKAPGLPHYAPNDLSFYANIPTPCSYMCMGSEKDFFGGYDYAAEAGIIHIANHHISPGKKQWTWGNQEFGYAWDRNLTDPNARGECAPYIEIMAGVYTDNQPDFSFLQPGETKTWSQYWYPIQRIGPALEANLDAALSLQPGRAERQLVLGIAVTRPFENAQIQITRRGQPVRTLVRNLLPGAPLVENLNLPADVTHQTQPEITVTHDHREIIAYRPQPRTPGNVPPPAAEPPLPKNIASADQLYLTGLHLEQYRHATRCPTLYWREALRRDPGDARCNNAIGLWLLRRGEFTTAQPFFRQAIERLTSRNANPYDGEPFYNLGLCLRYAGHDDQAYDAFYKATWNQACARAAYHALAEIDCTRKNWTRALDHLDRSLRLDLDNLRARNLKVMVLRQLGNGAEASDLLHATRQLDPLDWWARWLAGEKLNCDLQLRLDLAHDCARAGFYPQAIDLLDAFAGKPRDLPDQNLGALPLVFYTRAWLELKRGDTPAAQTAWKDASRLSHHYCFPARLDEIAVLQAAIRHRPSDPLPYYLLGNLFYDRRRHEEALRLWQRSVKLDPSNPQVWRNLGIAYCNIRNNPAKARAAYERAVRANPGDARLIYERDQLWKRLGEVPAVRLRELERRIEAVHQRDDLTIELCALYNQTAQHSRALALVNSRQFQPWEGGEGGPLGQHVRSHLALGRGALATGQTDIARRHFEAALTAPANLSEARHLLANQSDIHYWLGCALTAQGNSPAARQHWSAAANFKGDFQEMSARAFSEMTYYSALALVRLGQKARAAKLFRELLAYARALQRAEAKIDYFATSLPTMLLFNDDLQTRQVTTALFLQAQAQLGLGKRSTARQLLQQVLERDPNHPLAADLLTETHP